MPEFRVYVVELSAAACSRTDCSSRRTGKPHVYVGETKKTPEERLADHRAGGFTSRPVVRDHSIGLLPTSTGPCACAEPGWNRRRRRHGSPPV